MKQPKKISGIFRLLVGCLLVLSMAFAGAGSAFAYDSTESLFGDRGWLPNAAGALGKNFCNDWDVFYAGSTYKFKKSGTDYEGKRIKLVSLQWYAGKKKISTKLSYKIPDKYLGKFVYVKVKYRVNHSKKVHTQTIPAGWDKHGEAAFAQPAYNYRGQTKVKGLKKGKIVYRLSNTGLGTKDEMTYATQGQTYAVAVTPLATRWRYYNSTQVRDYNFAHTKKLSGTKIRYQWFYREAGDHSWTKIPGATGKSYTAPQEYDGYILGVTFSVKKKNYVAAYGFANMERLEW